MQPHLNWRAASERSSVAGSCHSGMACCVSMGVVRRRGTVAGKPTGVVGSISSSSPSGLLFSYGSGVMTAPSNGPAVRRGLVGSGDENGTRSVRDEARRSCRAEVLLAEEVRLIASCADGGRGARDPRLATVA